jgi:GntR family transcriptional regulator
VLISIDEKDGRPLYQQLVSQVKEQVGNGTLQPGDELPSVRELAESLGVNMHTVRSAYLKLRDQGIISLRLGRRAKITRLKPEPAAGMEADLKLRLKDLITDATLMGLTPDEFRDLVERQLKETGNR